MVVHAHEATFKTAYMQDCLQAEQLKNTNGNSLQASILS